MWELPAPMGKAVNPFLNYDKHKMAGKLGDVNICKEKFCARQHNVLNC